MLFIFLTSEENQTVFRNEVTGLILTANSADLLLWAPDGQYRGAVIDWSQHYVGSRPFIYVSTYQKGE